MYLKICRHHLSFDGCKYQSTGSADASTYAQFVSTKTVINVRKSLSTT